MVCKKLFWGLKPVYIRVRMMLSSLVRSPLFSPPLTRRYGALFIVFITLSHDNSFLWGIVARQTPERSFCRLKLVGHMSGNVLSAIMQRLSHDRIVLSHDNSLDKENCRATNLLFFLVDESRLTVYVRDLSLSPKLIGKCPRTKYVLEFLRGS